MRALALLVVGSASAIPCTALAVRMIGLPNAMHPTKLALFAVLGLAVGQVWIALLGGRRSSLRASATRLVAACSVSLVLPSMACALYGAASWWTGLPLVSAPEDPGIIGWIAAALPVLAIASLAALHALLPLVERRSIGLSLRVHAASGFYVWILVARLIDRLRSTGGNALEGVTRA
jgi:membrane protease YdiL (CAAX protease family)